MKNNMVSRDYFKLFVKREGKVVLGKNFSSLWLLTTVLTLTLLAISFSNASINYLSEKMNDPFINWVEIRNTGEGELPVYELVKGIDDPENKALFNYFDCNIDTKENITLCGKDDSYTQYISCRGFNTIAGNPIMDVILAEDNIVNGAVVSLDKITDTQLGVIIKEDMVKTLGYAEIPAFIDYMSPSPGADTLGFNYVTQDYVRCPIPVLAVVRRLPGNVNMVSTKYFLEQKMNAKTAPFRMNKREYATSAHYFVPSTVDSEEFKKDLQEMYGQPCYIQDSDLPQIVTWKPGNYIGIRGEYGAEIEPMEVARLNAQIMSKYGERGVYRVYDMKCSDNPSPGDYISVQFHDLSKIRDFEEFIRNTYKYKIEMEQVNAKENFNAVSVMATILSWSIVGFSIICIILFIINLFQSYFQKVKRNLGTFKAFGISNSQLVGVYLLIMFAIITIAIIISLMISFAAELILPICGVMKDGTFNYLALNNNMTWMAIGIILFSSIMTVYMVMRKLLSTTPGNLIYDR